MAKHNVHSLTAMRAANPNTTVHQAIAMLLNAPGKTMTEQQFLTGLTQLSKPSKKPKFTLNSLMSAASHQYGGVIQRQGNMIVFSPAWLVEIQKYQW